MDWQATTTFFILAIAAGILFKRLRAFVGAGKSGSCGSCAGCGNSAKDNTPVLLVPLGTAIIPKKKEANRHQASDAGAEKTG